MGVSYCKKCYRDDSLKREFWTTGMRTAIVFTVSCLAAIAAYDGRLSTALFVGFVALGTLHAISSNK